MADKKCSSPNCSRCLPRETLPKPWRAYGNYIIGGWYHPTTHKEYFPSKIHAEQDRFEWLPHPDYPGWVHPAVGGVRLEYDEAA